MYLASPIDDLLVTTDHHTWSISGIHHLYLTINFVLNPFSRKLRWKDNMNAAHQSSGDCDNGITINRS